MVLGILNQLEKEHGDRQIPTSLLYGSEVGFYLNSRRLYLNSRHRSG